MKKIAIIGTVGIPAKYGGFETLAHHLTKELQNEFEFQVYNSSTAYSPSERLSEFNGAKLIYLPFKANGIQSIVYDIVSMIHALFTADVLLVLGVSGGLFTPIVRLFSNKKIIVNIDGLEWRRAKWNKYTRWFLKLSEKVAVKFSHADITDNMAIKRYTAKFYKTLSHFIAYGADHTIKVRPKKDDFKQYPFLVRPYAFKVARIEPENNIELILEAFSVCSQQLVVVGNWNNSPYGKALVEKYGNDNYSNIQLLDPIYDQRSLDLLRSNAFVYVHGHSAGGTNPSLVEAMYLGLPTLCYDVSYNRATTENSALFFKNSDELIELVQKTEVSKLKTIGKNLETIAIERYSWNHIADKYRKLFLTFDYNYTKQKTYRKNTPFYDQELYPEGRVQYRYLLHSTEKEQL